MEKKKWSAIDEANMIVNICERKLESPPVSQEQAINAYKKSIELYQSSNKKLTEVCKEQRSDLNRIVNRLYYTSVTIGVFVGAMLFIKVCL